MPGLHYFDASYLVPLVRREASSADVEAFTRAIPEGLHATSHWARVECRSGLAREVRMGHMTQQEYADICSRLDRLLSDSFLLIVPVENDYWRAWDMMDRPEGGLRGGDALHIAIAGRINADYLLSLDRGIVAEATVFGLRAGAGFDGWS